MTIKKATDHFVFKLKNVWKASENDIEAFNTIIDFIEKKHNKQLNDNELFAKLYISFYGELLRYYKATVFDKIPQKAIHKILDTPIENLIEKFISKATEVEQTIEFEKNGMYLHPNNYTSQQKEKVRIIEPVIRFEEARDNLTSMINLALNEFSKPFQNTNNQN